MSPVDKTADLLVHWWNFSSNTPQQGALYATSAVSGSESTGDCIDGLGLQALLASASHQKEFLQPSGASGTGYYSERCLLDEWLDDRFGPQDFATFQQHLENRDLSFSIVLKDARTYTGSLGYLCSIAMAQLMLTKPNPLFYLPLRSLDGEKGPHDTVFFDPRWLLPTADAKEARNALLKRRTPVVLSPGQVVLFGTFLPELVGLAVMENVSLLSAHSRVTESEEDTVREPTGASNRSQTRYEQRAISPIGRFLLLGVAQLAKKLLGPSVASGNWQEKIIRAFIGPRPSKPDVGSVDYRELQRLIRGSRGKVVVR